MISNNNGCNIYLTTPFLFNNKIEVKLIKYARTDFEIKKMNFKQN